MRWTDRELARPAPALSAPAATSPTSSDERPSGAEWAAAGGCGDESLGARTSERARADHQALSALRGRRALADLRVRAARRGALPLVGRIGHAFSDSSPDPNNAVGLQGVPETS